MNDKKCPVPPYQTSTERISGPPPEPLQPPSSRGVMLVIYHGTGDARVTLEPGQTLVVGRTPPADLVVPESSLSRSHARFSLINGRIFIDDLDSTNHTWLGKEKVKREELTIGAEVTLGESVVVRVFALGAAGDPTVEDESAFRRRLAKEVERAAYCGRSFALLAVRAADAEARPSASWTTGLRGHLRPIDSVGLHTPRIVLALLPEAGPDEALELARAIASEREVEGAPWRVGVAVYPGASLTAEGLIERAREAADRATPVEPVASASTALWTEIREDVPGGMVTGTSMAALLAQARQVAPTRLSVLLHGETGTGKDLLARFIHAQGPRRARPMVSVNCGIIMASLLGSTLFGHEKGSFTGAERQHQGLFEAAHRGTFFLDEIGELTMDAQAALLRVLDTGTFCRVGSTQEIKVDVRIIAATHRDLGSMVAEGRFRKDLYFRLSQMVLEIPPLRERLDVLPRLAEHFLDDANRKNNRRVRGFTDEAMALLRAYAWPGNIRELSSAVEVAVVMTRGELVRPEYLPATVRAAQVMEASRAGEVPSPEPAPGGGAGRPRSKAKDALQRAEAAIYKEALERAGGRVTEAAKQLGMPRRTLSAKLKRLGLGKPKT